MVNLNRLLSKTSLKAFWEAGQNIEPLPSTGGLVLRLFKKSTLC